MRLARRVAELEDAYQSGRLLKALIPVDEALSEYPSVRVTENQSVRFKNGGTLDVKRLGKKLPPGLIRVYSPDGDFLGLGEIKADGGEMSVKRVLVNK